MKINNYIKKNTHTPARSSSFNTTEGMSRDIAAAAQARAVHGRLLQHGVHTYVHKDDLMCMTDAWIEPVQQRQSSPELSSISPTGVPVCKMRIAQLAKASHNQSVAGLRKDM